MKTEKYIRTPTEIDCVQVTKDNMQEVAEWCGGEVFEIKNKVPNLRQFIEVPVLNPQHVRHGRAFVGDWVVMDPRGVKVFNPQVFGRHFVQLGTTGVPVINVVQTNTVSPLDLAKLQRRFNTSDTKASV